jgi:hypothetical protein
MKDCVLSVPYAWSSVILAIDAYKYLTLQMNNYNQMMKQLNMNTQSNNAQSNSAQQQPKEEKKDGESEQNS